MHFLLICKLIKYISLVVPPYHYSLTQPLQILSIIFASSYAVTDRAWRALRDMSTDQCVLISGEAGSGKTESAKLTLQYLAAVTGHAKEFHNIKYQLLQSNSVLEGKLIISKIIFTIRTFRIWVILETIILVSIKVIYRSSSRITKPPLQFVSSL